MWGSRRLHTQKWPANACQADAKQLHDARAVEYSGNMCQAANADRVYTNTPSVRLQLALAMDGWLIRDVRVARNGRKHIAECWNFYASLDQAEALRR